LLAESITSTVPVFVDIAQEQDAHASPSV